MFRHRETHLTSDIGWLKMSMTCKTQQNQDKSIFGPVKAQKFSRAWIILSDQQYPLELVL